MIGVVTHMRLRYFDIFASMVCILFFLTGCAYTAHKKYISDVKEYAKIREMTGLHHGQGQLLPLFPQSLNQLTVKQFFCRYDEQLPLGEGIQIFLEIEYREPDFYEEVDRIASLATQSNDLFSNNGCDIYARELGIDNISEYACIDLEERFIRYIFLQDIPKAEIEFDKEWLPMGYSGYGEIKSQ